MIRHSVPSVDFARLARIFNPGRLGTEANRFIEFTLSYLASGMTYQEILEDFPSLTQEDILACLSYAADRERQTLVAQA